MGRLTILEFHRRVNIQVPYIVANNNRFLIDEDLKVALVSDLARLNDLQIKCSNPVIRTIFFVHQRQALIIRFKKKIRTVINAIQYMLALELTVEDREELFIKIRKVGSRIPKPILSPRISVIERNIGALKIRFSDSEKLGHRRFPEGVQFVNIFVAIVSADAQRPINKDFHLFKTETKATVSLQFRNEDWKKVAHIKAEFGNRNGVGILSEVVEVVIPN